MSQRALIIVDMLNDFIHEKGTLYCGPQSQAIIRPIAKRLQAFRQQGDSVIFTQDSHDEKDPEFDRFPRHCVSGIVLADRVTDQKTGQIHPTE